MLCVVGSYAIHNNVVEVAIMLIFGVIGYLARKFDFNAAAIVLGLILGPIGEQRPAPLAAASATGTRPSSSPRPCAGS